MAVIAVMRGKPKDGYHRHRSNKNYANRGVTCKYNTTNEYIPPEADFCYGRSNGKPKMATTVVISTTYKQRVLLDRGHNGHLVFVAKDKPMLLLYLKRRVP